MLLNLTLNFDIDVSELLCGDGHLGRVKALQTVRQLIWTRRDSKRQRE
jgi:hypothetical protein